MAALRPLFVTQIYQASLAEEPGFELFNTELKAACQMLASEDRAGQRWCKAHGYRGYTSYASLADLPKRATVFDELRRRLDRHASAYGAALGFDLGRRRLKLDSLWVNVLHPGGSHSGHVHPNSILSGTVYVETPDRAGALRLEDPRLPMMMASPAIRADAPEDQQRFVYLHPEPGSVIVWESWLRHEVLTNGARGRRISLSFNYA